MPLDRGDRVRSYLELISGSLERAREDVERLSASGTLERPTPAAARGRREAEIASAGPAMDTLASGASPPPDELATIEAIIIPNLRPVFDVSGGSFRVANPLWSKLSDEPIRRRIEEALPAIGRIELPGHATIPYAGTGFVVGKHLLMTNRHVASLFAKGVGERRLRFTPGDAGVDFKREQDNKSGRVFAVRSVRMVHPYWDMAILGVEGLEDIDPLSLSLEDARDLRGEEIAVIGYPAFDGRNPEDVQNDLFDGRFGTKRLQPGLLQGGFGAESFGKLVQAASHDCSTLGGNSGSALICLRTGEVVGLHFAGRYLERNYAVPSSALAHDSRIVNTGVNFAGDAPGKPNDWGIWWQHADASEAAAAAEDDSAGIADDGGGAATQSTRITLQEGSVVVEVPLRIAISLGPAVTAATATMAPAGEIETPGSKIVPHTEADYRDRTGYDPDFLTGDSGEPVTVPMPTARDPDVLAQLKSGGDTLHYQNFSVQMHKVRRLALITACNVTQEHRLRKPEPGRDYSRKGLFKDRWFPDARLDELYQLPDRFFTKDEGAFDRGHVVRRDDVAWGATFEALLKGNVDSFHGTNCSPQVKGFNRSDSGRDNWGDLENHVLSEAASERLCVFAGPVLADSDRVFVGQGAGGTTIRARIPTAFWKVVVARVLDGLAAYGFILDQDLSAVPLEFAVADEFVRHFKPLDEIEERTGVVFGQALQDADQYGTVRGAEVALRAGVRIERRGDGTIN